MRKYLTEEQKALIEKLYVEENKSTPVIETILGVRRETVGYYLKSRGLLRSLHQAIALRDGRQGNRVSPTWSFLPLDSDKAWLLGLIYGDGCITGNRANTNSKIIITSSDEDILTNVNSMFGNGLGLIIDKRSANYKSIRICSTKLCKELKEYFGIIPNKSDKLVYPDLALLGEYESDFIRGLLDSDGCFSSNDRRLRFIYACCSKEFTNVLHKRVAALSNIVVVGEVKTRIFPDNPNKKDAYVFTYSGTKAIAIGEMLYLNSRSTNRGDRKYKIWQLASAS